MQCCYVLYNTSFLIMIMSRIQRKRTFITKTVGTNIKGLTWRIQEVARVQAPRGQFSFFDAVLQNLHYASDRTVKPTIFTWLPLLSQIICIGRHPFHFSPSFFICLHFRHPFSFHCLLKGNCKDHKGNKHHLSRKVWEVTRNVFQWIANVHSLQKEAAFTFFPCSKLMHY